VYWWQAIVLGLVEGITEYLPVSSTGHLILAESLLNPGGGGPGMDAFTIVIQGGAILAVLGLYRRSVLDMLAGLLGRNAAGRRLLVNLIVAFVPAMIAGLALHEIIKARLFRAGPVLAALVLGGVYMIVQDRWLRRLPRDGTVDLDDMTWRQALVIGLFQCVALWPGTSRSMMTITAGVWLGLSPANAARFSFLLGLPTLGGAVAYELFNDIASAHATGQPSALLGLGAGNILLGVLVATVSAALAVRWLVAFLNHHGLGGFGWYRIALAVLLGVLIAGGIVGVG